MKSKKSRLPGGLGRRLFKGRKRISKLLYILSGISLPKRQKFVFSVLLLSVGLFISQYLLGRSGFYLAIFLSILSCFMFLWANLKDIRENKNGYIFILPFFFTLAVGLFYFLFPSRLIVRVGITSLFAIGLYSLYLCLNIFTVASIKTIALLSSARIVSFVISIFTYFLLVRVIFSFHLSSIFPILGLLIVVTFFLVLQALWTIRLENNFKSYLAWTLSLTLCLAEIAIVLWFWPSSNPNFIAIFLMGFFYVIVGLSQVWFDRRLFKGVVWGYAWMSLVVFLVFLFFGTQWSA